MERIRERYIFKIAKSDRNFFKIELCYVFRNAEFFTFALPFFEVEGRNPTRIIFTNVRKLFDFFILVIIDCLYVMPLDVDIFI